MHNYLLENIFIVFLFKKSNFKIMEVKINSHNL
jgi:hypothetical protein